MRYDAIICDGEVIFPHEGVGTVDIAIAQGRIAAILASGAAIDAAEIVEARGLTVFPRVIDPHLHMGIRRDGAIAVEPGFGEYIARPVARAAGRLGTARRVGA